LLLRGTGRRHLPKMATSYFVSALTGSDTNSGTINAPFKTISHGVKLLKPGTSLYLRAGGVYNEQVVPTVSGTQSFPILISGYQSEVAIIDGTGLTLKGANNAAGAAGLVQLTGLSWITLSGLEIRNVTSTNAFVAGLSVEGSGDHVTLSGLSIHDISSEKSGAHGLGVYGTAYPAGITNLTITGCQLYNLKLGQSESMALNGNVQYWSVSGCTVHDSDNIGIDAIGYEGTCSNSQYDSARNGSISNNIIYNINDNSNPTYPKNDQRNRNRFGTQR
jgi:hypothetical protein